MPLMKEQKLRGYITCPREPVNNKGIQNQIPVYILGFLYHSMCFPSKRNFIFFFLEYKAWGRQTLIIFSC